MTSREGENEPLSEALNKTLLNSEWIEQIVEEKLEKTIFDPGWVADQLAKGFVHIMNEYANYEGGLPAIGGGYAQQLYVNAKNVYISEVIKPRAGLVFPAEDQIIKDLRGKFQRGSFIETDLTVGYIPTKDAEVWIVADIDPEEVQKNNNSINNRASSVFVCFREEDAKQLAKQIKKNQ